MQEHPPKLEARNRIWSLISPILIFTVLLGLSVLMTMSGAPKLSMAGWVLLFLFALLLAFCFMWVWSDGIFERRKALIIDENGIWYRPGWRKAMVFEWSDVVDVRVKELKAETSTMKLVEVDLRKGALGPVAADFPGLPPDPKLEIYLGNLDRTEEDVAEVIKQNLELSGRTTD